MLYRVFQKKVSELNLHFFKWETLYILLPLNYIGNFRHLCPTTISENAVVSEILTYENRALLRFHRLQHLNGSTQRKTIFTFLSQFFCALIKNITFQFIRRKKYCFRLNRRENFLLPLKLKRAKKTNWTIQMLQPVNM